MLRKGARVSVTGSLRQFLYTVEGAAEKVPGYQILADDITLALGRVDAVSYRPKREEAPRRPESPSLNTRATCDPSHARKLDTDTGSEQ